MPQRRLRLTDHDAGRDNDSNPISTIRRLKPSVNLPTMWHQRKKAGIATGTGMNGHAIPDDEADIRTYRMSILKEATKQDSVTRHR